MADMELDLDVPSQAPARPTGSRFLPKGSKPLPKPRVKAEPVPSSSASGSVNVQAKEESDNPISLPKLEESDSKPPPLFHIDETVSVDESNVVRMDIDVKEAVNDVPMKVEEQVVGKEEDHDEIINEIDVYFTPSIDPNTKLYVLQYPLRPLWRPYELDERCKEVRVKPTSGEVEVDLAIDIESDQNYDHHADPRITKQTLSSSWKPPARTAYAVGVLAGNKLHLNPIHAVVQLRPSLDHLKPEVLRKKGTTSTNAEDLVKTEEVKEEKPTGSSVKQNKSQGALTELAGVGEEWMPLQYFGARSDISARYLCKMMEKDDSPIQFLMSPHDYLNTLCPGTSNNNSSVQGRCPSIRSLLSLPLEERFKKWLREGPPSNRFDTLKYLAPEESAEEVLRVVQKYAQLVQGLWVAKSSLLYGTESGVNVLARDYILVHFRKNLVITNRELPQKSDLRNASKDVLNVLARPSGNDWKFNADPDMKFLKLHPQIKEEQEQAWIRMEELIHKVLGGKNRHVMKNSSMSTSSLNQVTAKSADKVVGSKVANGSMLSKAMPAETKEALLSALIRVLKGRGFSFPQICQSLRQLAVSESSRPKGSAREAKAAADAVDAFPEEIQKIVNEVAINIHGVYVLRSSPDNSQHDALRKVVIDLLIGQGPNAKLKKLSVFEAAKLQLKREISNDEYQKVINELCVSQNSAWVLKGGDGNLK